MIKAVIASSIDLQQFAYMESHNTEDAVISVTHLISKYLGDSNAYAQILFADFSSAFDTVHPQLLVHKLLEVKISPLIIKCFYSLLTNRPQQVNGTLSTTGYLQLANPNPGFSKWKIMLQQKSMKTFR